MRTRTRHATSTVDRFSLSLSLSHTDGDWTTTTATIRVAFKCCDNMAREMGRNCCVNWWRPHQRAETFPTLFFFFFFFLRRWRGLCRSKQDGRSDGLNFVDSFYYLNEFGGVATALRPVNDDVVFSGQTQSEIAVMSRRFDERRRRWRRHGSIAAAGRRFIHSTDAAAHSRCALNVGPSPGDGRRWQQRRHGTCFGTRNEDVRRRRRKKPNGRRETSISTGRGSHHFWGSQFLDFRNDLLMDCFFFFFVFFLFFLKFWNFGWEVHRHHKE